MKAKVFFSVGLIPKSFVGRVKGCMGGQRGRRDAGFDSGSGDMMSGGKAFGGGTKF